MSRLNQREPHWSGDAEQRVHRRRGTHTEMHTSYADQVMSGTHVWIWVVRLGKGKWWPGVVEHVTMLADQPTFRVRFESSSAKGSRQPTFVGVSTTRARYLELRDPDVKGDDRPRFVPISLLHQPADPERTASVGGTHGDPGRAND